jgi:hypothetical protein
MIRVTRIFLGLGLATILLLGSSSIAHAQYQAPPPGYYAPPPGYGGGYPPPPPPRYRYRYRYGREGLVFGVALGVGGTSASNCGDICGPAGAFEAHIGGMVSPTVALEGDVWVNGHDGANDSSTHTLYTFAVQFWPADLFWLKAGIGGGHMGVSSDINGYSDEDGLGVLAAGGIEFLHFTTFALDGQLRWGHGFYSEGGDVNVWALMIGANWY